MFWSFAQARMTAASFTQYTNTLSIPLAFSSALFATCVSYASMASGARTLISTRVTNVAGDLELGSAGRERAGQAHDQDLLAGAGFPDVEEDGRVELEAVLRA